MEENQSRNVKDPVSTNNEVSERRSRPITENHPLNNVVILDSIIRHLGYKDLKNVRLVCHQWKEVTKNVFWKLSRIKVSGNEEEIVEENQKLIDTFESTFPSSAGLPTNAMKFEGFINRRTMEYFWKERGSLTLTSVYFLFCEPTEECFDLNRYITPKLTTLNIGFSPHQKFKVSLKMLTNIQNLQLFMCEIVLDGKIVPRELDLRVSSVFHEGKLLKSADFRNRQKILINDFIDFSKIKSLTLGSDFWKLDVGSDTKELSHLSLDDVELIGLDNSQWKTNFVDFKQGCICIGDRMEIKAFPGIGNRFAITVDLESLPKTLEHLLFSISSYDSSFTLPQPMIFAYLKLKSLGIKISTTGFRILDFTSCSSLVDFQFSSYSDMHQMDFNRIILPNSIKNVKLRNVIPTADVPWQLETLVLYKYRLSSMERTVRHFTTAKLVILFDFYLERQEDQMFIINHWRSSLIEQLACGYSYGDEIKRCFLFTNKNTTELGEAIDRDKFQKLSSLNVHKDLLPYMVI